MDSMQGGDSRPDSVTGDRKEKLAPSQARVDFNVEDVQTIHLKGPQALCKRDLMSPYVWLEPDGRLGIMVRAVPAPDQPRSDTGQIWAGWSDDGVTFDMLD